MQSKFAFPFFQSSYTADSYSVCNQILFHDLFFSSPFNKKDFIPVHLNSVTQMNNLAYFSDGFNLFP